MSNTPTVVSVINLKGGVGKTTVTALLARYAARQGLDVLAVDLDPQANLSQALMTTDDYTKFMDER
ncbi:ParA family protein [Candidatus Spongiihabitans sp.]|uniref:ParA family protein n=1 Tax=Candidatus Spongiihabitans sp. TaxID=3101308 RepID=UPI003C6FA16A